MRLWIILFILLVPLAHADGWYYAGDTWEEDGILYSVEGNDPDSVLLGVDGQLYLIALYDCKNIRFVEYCYTQTAYPDDEDHVKYEAGEKLYGHYITFESFAPDVTVSRDVEDTSVSIGEETEVEITIKNQGDFTVNYVTYRMSVPEGVAITSGPRNGRQILYEQTALQLDQQTRFRYRLKAEGFGTFSFDPNLTYEFDGQQHSIDPGDWTLTVNSPLDVSTHAPDTLDIDERGTYSANITNKEEEDITVTVAAAIPESVEVVDGLSLQDGTYAREYLLREDEKAEIAYDFYLKDSATLPLDVTFTHDGHTSTTTYSETVTTDEKLITADVRIFPSRGPYRSGTTVNVSGILTNTNDKVRFHKVKGRLESDLWPTALFGHESFTPGKELTEIQRTVALPVVDTRETYPITVRGTYESPRGTVYEFSATKSITVEPSDNLVAISRTVSPAEPVKGGNVSVTVNAKNKRGAYVTFTAEERLPQGVERAGGLTYAERSLERDAEGKVYQYQLRIPEDYPASSITVTTVATIKGEDVTETSSTEIPLADPPAPDESPGEEETEEEDLIVEDEEEEGFFKRAWDWVKKLFS